MDSFKLLTEINKQALRNDRIINCLLQIHIAQEEHKFGFNESGLVEMLSSQEFKTLENVKVAGLMGMATYTEEQGQIRLEFKKLKKLFTKIKGSFSSSNLEMQEISMGMSDDYLIAIEEGSTMIRVGSKIFGPRIYH